VKCFSDGQRPMSVPIPALPLTNNRYESFWPGYRTRPLTRDPWRRR
jgi:hypothetical protein